MSPSKIRLFHHERLDVATKTMILSGLKLVIWMVWPWKLTWWIDNKKRKKKKNVPPFIFANHWCSKGFCHEKQWILSVKTRHLGVQRYNLARSWNYPTKWMSKNDRYRTNNIMGVEWNVIPACCLKPNVCCGNSPFSVGQIGTFRHCAGRRKRHHRRWWVPRHGGLDWARRICDYTWLRHNKGFISLLGYPEWIFQNDFRYISFQSFLGWWLDECIFLRCLSTSQPHIRVPLNGSRCQQSLVHKLRFDSQVPATSMTFPPSTPLRPPLEPLAHGRAWDLPPTCRRWCRRRRRRRWHRWRRHQAPRRWRHHSGRPCRQCRRQCRRCRRWRIWWTRKFGETHHFCPFLP